MTDNEILEAFNALVVKHGGGVMHPVPGGSYSKHRAFVGDTAYLGDTAFGAMRAAVEAQVSPDDLTWAYLEEAAAFARSAVYGSSAWAAWKAAGAPVPKRVHPLALAYLEAAGRHARGDVYRGTQESYDAWEKIGAPVYAP